MKFYEVACLIAESIRADTHDDFRPDELRGLKDAEHPTCLYYRFFNRLACVFRPFNAIEIGTYAGVSAAHLAFSNRVRITDNLITYGQVVTIDVNPDAARCVNDIQLQLMQPNIMAITGDSLGPASQRFSQQSKADVLFIDGNHTFRQAYAEYYTYRQFIREGGLIIIDDAGLPMDGDEMNVLWETIPEPKTRFDHLHPNVGFGIVEKRNDVHVLTPDVAFDHASPIIACRRK